MLVLYPRTYILQKILNAAKCGHFRPWLATLAPFLQDRGPWCLSELGGDESRWPQTLTQDNLDCTPQSTRYSSPHAGQRTGSTLPPQSSHVHSPPPLSYSCHLPAISIPVIHLHLDGPGRQRAFGGLGHPHPPTCGLRMGSPGSAALQVRAGEGSHLETS
jgi:hypothetical protein